MISDYSQFFKQITDVRPYSYQRKLGEGEWPELLDIPTGLGKTAALGIAWIWKRVQRDPATPRRLVYCLPMRTLVEQTARHFDEWLEAAEEYFPDGEAPRSQILMGGEAEDLWAREPERASVILGTQDMLLSRALNRGYGMSPFQWPIHFGLFHSDALWVFDEVQLMGPGIATSAQLEGLRKSLPAAGRRARSLWCSATISSGWLNTFDHSPSSKPLVCDERDREQARDRLEAVKRLEPAATRLDKSSKTEVKSYLDALAEEVVGTHVDGTRTLVILNRVDRARELYKRLGKLGSEVDLLLLHSRFRPKDRKALESRLHEDVPEAGQIVISTQVVEAGVDISSATLFTELCPWSSFVQRCGRCNRRGERNDEGDARVIWIDLAVEDDGTALPYESADLELCRQRLGTLSSVSPSELPTFHDPAPVTPVLRRRDLMDLFSTDSDLSGFHVDVSPYIRDSDETTVQVFWRELGGKPPEPAESAPDREELCSTSLAELSKVLGKRRSGWRWDPQAPRTASDEQATGRWVRVGRRDLYPGLVVMLASESGGYDPKLGFDPGARAHVEPERPDAAPRTSPASHGSDHRSRGAWVPLHEHLRHVRDEMVALAEALSLDDADAAVLRRSALWHDVGKLHSAFQDDLLRRLPEDDPKRKQVWAKSAGGRRWSNETPTPEQLRRRYFRHELASALAALKHEENEPDLVAYLVAAHHGKVRTGLRAWPEEPSPEDGQRYARGIWEGDVLGEFEGPDGLRMPETRLDLGLMEMGVGFEEGESRPSWIERVEGLLARHGPFRLAWLEALLRMADWRASAKESSEPKGSTT